MTNWCSWVVIWNLFLMYLYHLEFIFRNIPHFEVLGLFPKLGNAAGYPPDHTYIFYSSSYLAVIHCNHQIQSTSQRFIRNSSYAKHILTESIRVCSIERSWIVITFGRFFFKWRCLFNKSFGQFVYCLELVLFRWTVWHTDLLF